MTTPTLLPVPLDRAYRLLNHGPVTLVSSAHAGRANVMAAAWAMPLDFMPPKVLVVIDRSTLTRELVEGSGEFVLNIPSSAQAAAVLAAGSGSGRTQEDKIAVCGLERRPATQVGAPLIAGCLGWLECRVLPEPQNQRQHDLFIAEVVAAQADAQVFRDGRWQFAPEGGPRTLHYIAGGAFLETGRAITVETPHRT
jgi:flavin reductase (DIM6/NTAB) family NADH-FMN oxidoreductase RutF